MKAKNIYDFDVPDFLLPAIYNYDLSGLEDSDIKVYEKANNTFRELVKENKGKFWVLNITKNEDGTEQEPSFSTSPDFTNLACNVYQCELYIF